MLHDHNYASSLRMVRYSSRTKLQVVNSIFGPPSSLKFGRALMIEADKPQTHSSSFDDERTGYRLVNLGPDKPARQAEGS